MPHLVTRVSSSVLSIVLLLLQGAAWPQSPACNFNQAPNFRDTNPISLDTASNPGRSFDYHDYNPNEVSGVTLPQTFVLPDAINGGFSSAVGAFSGDTFTSSFPWASNNSLLGGQGAGCIPGINCGTCATSAIDCTGQPIPKSQAVGIRSAPFSTSSGFTFMSTLEGTTTVPAGASVIQTVFWHESPIYLTGREYGFFRDVTTNGFYFYWDTNSNCTAGATSSGMPISICSEPQGSTPNIFTTNFGSCSLNSSFDPIPFSNYLGYAAIIFRDPSDARYKFWVQVGDPVGTYLQNLIVDPAADPNTSSFPTASLATAAGYVTAGITRSDSQNMTRYTGAVPSMSISGITIEVR